MGMLRVMLAMAVLLTHLPPASYKFMSGGLAVQAFFIVSGFYMALVLDGKYKDARLFYSNRLLRLFPSYGVMLIVGAIALFALNGSATATPDIFASVFRNPVSAAIMAFENLCVFGQELLFWFTIGPDGGLVFNASGAVPDAHTSLAWQALLVPQSWSLSMELMFYLFAPLLARLNWLWLAVIAAASIALRLAGHSLPVSYGIWQGRLFPTALFLFVIGMLAQRTLPFATRLPKAIGYVATIAVLALVATLPLWKLEDETARWLVYAELACAIPFIFNAFKDFAFDRWIGDLSYPLYLTHLAVIGLVLTYAPAAWQIPLAIGGSLALSLALLVLIDHPVDRWRQARARGAGRREVVIALKQA